MAAGTIRDDKKTTSQLNLMREATSSLGSILSRQWWQRSTLSKPTPPYHSFYFWNSLAYIALCIQTNGDNFEHYTMYATHGDYFERLTAMEFWKNSQLMIDSATMVQTQLPSIVRRLRYHQTSDYLDATSCEKSLLTITIETTGSCDRNMQCEWFPIIYHGHGR